MSLNYVELLIEQQDAGQDAGSGAVTITPTWVVTAAGITVVSQVPVVRQLSSGTVTVSLVACDNAGISPASGFWAYSITLPGAQPQLYLVNYSNGSSQRLDSLTPVVPMITYGPAAGGGVTSVFGRSGAVVAGSGDYTAGEVGALAAAASSTSVPAAALTPKVAPALTDGSSVAIDASAGNVFDWPLGGASHTLAAPSNPADGQVITVRVRYGGSFTPLFSAIYDFASNAPSWTATSGKSDHAAFAYDAAANSGAGAWRCLNSGGLGYTS